MYTKKSEAQKSLFVHCENACTAALVHTNTQTLASHYNFNWPLTVYHILVDFTFAYLTLDCHSEISCVEQVIGVGAEWAHPAATASFPSQLLQEEPIEHSPVSSTADDHSPDHVPHQSKSGVLTWPAHHIDLTTSASLLRAAIERKELFILDHCLRTHSLPSELALR